MPMIYSGSELLCKHHLPSIKVVRALRHIRKIRGGSQAHLIQCSDGEYYVVKFRNNPQHPRLLANELFATRLAAAVKLPVLPVAFVNVSKEFIATSRLVNIELPDGNQSCEAGVQFGSGHPGYRSEVFDYLPSPLYGDVWNAPTICGALAFDLWTGNVDYRQCLFLARPELRRVYVLIMIDQGHCFGGGRWEFDDNPFRSLYPEKRGYEIVDGWDCFDPWLTRIEKMKERVIRTIASEIPPQWYGEKKEELDHLVERLIKRRSKIRELIEIVRESPEDVFPNWLSAKKGPVTSKSQTGGVQEVA